MQATPAYTPVAARKTMANPKPPTQSAPVKYEWPAKVREYVQRAFGQDNRINGVSLKDIQAKLTELLTDAAQSGRTDSIDWATYPLPQQIIHHERSLVAAQHNQNEMLANLAAEPVAMTGPILPPPNPRKRKSTDAHESIPGQFTSQADIHTEETSDALKNIDLADRITGKPPSKKEKRQKRAGAFRAALGAGISVNPYADADAIRQRQKRFGKQLDPTGPTPHAPSRDDSPPGEPAPVVGTCQIIEKSYYRLTSAPKPESVRPVPVLRQALDLVRSKWRLDHNYRYACDQLKAVRQDLTVQNIKTEFTVEVYEAHARIALEMKDMGEYNQCQTQLRALYKMNLGGNPDEFLAYRILYIIYTSNQMDMNDVLVELTPAQKANPVVKQALEIRSAVAAGNYHKFFRLYDQALLMSPYLLDMFVQRERLAALARICKAYRPDLSLHVVAVELAFHGDEDESDPDAGARECLAFLCEHGAEQFVERKGVDVRLATSKAAVFFQKAAFGVGN